MASRSQKADVVIAGGGLSGGLLALRLMQLQPQLKVCLIERSDRFGGNHTWSCHSSDLAASNLEWIAPLLAGRWSSHSVRFPNINRTLNSGYLSIRSDGLHEALSSALGVSEQILGADVISIARNFVELADGRRFEAKAVVDARGLSASRPGSVGFQKFVGLDLELETPHALEGPVLMDASCEQLDGFRFFYLLPWDSRRLLVEDTRYSDRGEVDVAAFENEILAYVARQGWNVKKVDRREVGVLPIPLIKDFELKPTSNGVPRLGTRGELFHATTGYSLPWAIRQADAIAQMKSLSSESILFRINEELVALEKQGRFLRFLNRMLFRAAKPEQRRGVLEKFYRLPEPLIRRFYGGRLMLTDYVRILSGKPPVSVVQAVSCLW